MRRSLIAVLVLVLLAVAGAGVVVVQNTYDLREERVTIPAGPHPLNGVLATPASGRGPFGLVVFVHGDGPVDATHDGFYRPMWEAFARAGYASLSWNKPGVGGSAGNWLDQSMEERAKEVETAIAWARSRHDLDAGRVGLWGASQAGWVLPKVTARVPDLGFVIAVSPAINWLRQGRYNLLAEMRADGATAAEIRGAVDRSDKTLRLLRAESSFEQYRQAMGGEADGLTADRWRFILRNHTADATEDLRHPATGRIPTLLVLAGHDLNVDVAETEAVYRDTLSALQVRRYPDADHSLVRQSLAESELKLTLTAILAPRSLAPAGFFDDMVAFLRDPGRATRR
ncbi:alpha/beta hydrolase family protein [Planomonospora algeriensis]